MFHHGVFLTSCDRLRVITTSVILSFSPLNVTTTTTLDNTTSSQGRGTHIAQAPTTEDYGKCSWGLKGGARALVMETAVLLTG